MDTIRIENTGKPLMIAHRGLSGIEKENTASAFVAAGHHTYFGIETDVHRTADGQFIVIHDDDTRRVAGDEVKVEETCFDTLRAIRLIDTDGRKGRWDLVLPSLDEYIRICKKYGKEAVLELKNHFDPEDIRRIVEAIRAEEYLDHVIFISFDLPNMICIRELLPDQRAQFLVSAEEDWLIDTLKKYRLGLDIRYTALTKDLADRVHAIGQEVNVWTVNTPEDAERVIRMGADYITTNILE